VRDWLHDVRVEVCEAEVCERWVKVGIFDVSDGGVEVCRVEVREVGGDRGRRELLDGWVLEEGL
jgi:hypothetical protein